LDRKVHKVRLALLAHKVRLALLAHKVLPALLALRARLGRPVLLDLLGRA
jgi:hypothetical protein